MLKENWWIWCLNPCFNGILKYWLFQGVVWAGGVVLILVLMEY